MHITNIVDRQYEYLVFIKCTKAHMTELLKNQTMKTLSTILLAL